MVGNEPVSNKPESSEEVSNQSAQEKNAGIHTDPKAHHQPTLDTVSHGQPDLELANNIAQQQALKDAQEQQRRNAAEKSKEEVKANRKWAAVLKESKAAVKIKGQASYIEYSTAMMEFLAILSDLSKALAYTDFKIWEKTLGKTKIGQFLGAVGHAIKSTPDKFLKAVGLRESDPAPKLTYSMGIDEDNCLSLNPRVNGEKLGPELEEKANAGMIAWLASRGYQLEPNTGGFTNENDEVLTPERFKELDQDDELGFRQFMKNMFKLEMTPEPAPAPAPTPLSTKPY